jgi:energy-converting hydrogenase B subunit D
MLDLLVLLICVSIVVSAVLAVCLGGLLPAMISAGLASLFASACYVLLAAPDVAMAEASIGSACRRSCFYIPFAGSAGRRTEA